MRKQKRRLLRSTKCKMCGADITGSKHGTRYCPECSVKSMEYNHVISIRYKAIDICPEECYVGKDDAYINLAGAIVRLAIEDYSYALSMVKRYPGDEFYIKKLKILTKEIHSEYFDLLCLNVDPESLIREINKLYNEPKGY